MMDDDRERVVIVADQERPLIWIEPRSGVRRSRTERYVRDPILTRGDKILAIVAIAVIVFLLSVNGIH